MKNPKPLPAKLRCLGMKPFGFFAALRNDIQPGCRAGYAKVSVCVSPRPTPPGFPLGGRPLRNLSWYISRGALAVILNGAQRSEESKAFACKTALSWDETLWILRCTQNDIQRNCGTSYAKVSVCVSVAAGPGIGVGVGVGVAVETAVGVGVGVGVDVDAGVWKAASLTPCLRHRSNVLAPASASFRTAMIYSSV